MARRIHSKKRKHLGNRTFGGGNTKNRRGKGNRGGVGRAGYHKHKWLHTIIYEGTNKRDRGEHGFTNPTRKEYLIISLETLSNQITAGKHAPNADGVYEIVLPKTKVLSNGPIKCKLSHKLSIKAHGFSKNAVEKIKAAGGNAIRFEQKT